MIENRLSILSKNIISLLIIVLVLSIQSLIFAQDLTTAESAVLAEFAEKIEKDVAKDNVGCIMTAFVKDGTVAWSKSFGWADRGKKIKAAPDMIGRTGSISKSFTAVLMAVLIEQGIIGLDEPVSKYLLEVELIKNKPEGAVPITFRHLASHTSGLIREPKLSGAASGPIGTWTNKILESIPRTAYQDKPGDKYSYSNIGFGMLGYTLELAAGQPFMDMMKYYVFDPLKMENTTFIISQDQEELLATGYENGRDGSINTDYPYHEHNGRGYKVPNGGVYSTVYDLAKFIGVMTNAEGCRILKKETIDEMLKIQTPASGEGTYGLGFSITVLDSGKKLYGHGGSVSGYTAQIKFERDSGMGVVFLRNYNRGKTNLGRDAENLLRKMLGEK